MRRAPKPITPKYAAGSVHVIELAEMFAALAKVPTVRGSQAVGMPSDDFNGYISWREACDAAQFGKWTPPEIKHLSLPAMMSPSDEMTYRYEVSGDFLDVPAFIADEPEQWIVGEPILKPAGRIIRLSVEIGGLGDVPAEAMANRGQAIIALVNSLEMAGHSVEITIVRAFTNRHGHSYRFLIPIKHAGSGIDTNRLQFIIGHAGFYRRCLFGFGELAQGASMMNCGTRTQSYQPEGFDAHITHDAGRRMNLADSLKWATELALTLTAEN
jgi:hypothetical protein